MYGLHPSVEIINAISYMHVYYAIGSIKKSVHHLAIWNYNHFIIQNDWWHSNTPHYDPKQTSIYKTRYYKNNKLASTQCKLEVRNDNILPSTIGNGTKSQERKNINFKFSTIFIGSFELKRYLKSGLHKDVSANYLLCSACGTRGNEK